MILFQGKKKRDIAHLKRVRQEKIDDAAYWYMQGDYKEHMKSIMEAIDITDQILIRRRRVF